MDRVAKRLGRDLMRPTKELFALWQRVRDGTLTRLGLKRQTTQLRDRVKSLLLRGCFSQRRTRVGLCEGLLNRFDWLWTFLNHDGVEPTNNAAERALRHPVIWRSGASAPKAPRAAASSQPGPDLGFHVNGAGFRIVS